MAEFLLLKQYMALPKEARAKVRAAFDLKKSGPVEVEQNVVVSDGTTSEDCMAVSAARLRTYLGVEEGTFAALWEATVEKLNEPELPEAFVDNHDKSMDVSGLPPSDDGTVTATLSPEQEIVRGNFPSTESVSPFCDQCDGKKAHKVYCKNRT